MNKNLPLPVRDKPGEMDKQVGKDKRVKNNYEDVMNNKVIEKYLAPHKKKKNGS